MYEGTAIVRVKVATRSASPAAVPRTVTVYVPAAAVVPVLRVSVDASVVTGLGENAPVAPVGRPSTDSVTAPAKPVRVRVRLAVPLWPGCSVIGAGVDKE